MHSLDLTTTWVGYLSLIMFVIGYYFIAAEDRYRINKAKPALFIGTTIFMLIALYFKVHSLNPSPLKEALEKTIIEIAEIYFFLLVAMTYIEAMIDRRVFAALRYNLVSKGLNYKKLFWITGILSFFISPVADNLTTALILSTVLMTIDHKNKAFLVPGAINVVTAANAGGAWSPFGDITTLMVWIDGKGEFVEFLYLFPASFLGWFLTAFLLSLFIPNANPPFDAKEKKVEILEGGKVIIALFAFTIASAVLTHQILDLPAMWGMMFGLAILKLYIYKMNLRHDKNHQINPFTWMSKIENDTLLFFFGILAAVAGLHFLGYLEYFTKLYDTLGATAVNIGVGFISAFIDNVPVMSAVLKANPNMGEAVQAEWMLVTLTAGIGGSLISFGSAAGVSVMGRMKGIYTFSSHMKYAWAVLLGYALSIAIWYVQFIIFKLY